MSNEQRVRPWEPGFKHVEHQQKREKRLRNGDKDLIINVPPKPEKK